VNTKAASKGSYKSLRQETGDKMPIPSSITRVSTTKVSTHRGSHLRCRTTLQEELSTNLDKVETTELLALIQLNHQVSNKLVVETLLESIQGDLRDKTQK